VPGPRPVRAGCPRRSPGCVRLPVRARSRAKRADEHHVPLPQPRQHAANASATRRSRARCAPACPRSAPRVPFHLCHSIHAVRRLHAHGQILSVHTRIHTQRLRQRGNSAVVKKKIKASLENELFRSSPASLNCFCCACTQPCGRKGAMRGDEANARSNDASAHARERATESEKARARERCISAYIRTRTRKHKTHARRHACVHALVWSHACMCVCVRTWMHACKLACIHARTNAHNHVHVSLPSGIVCVCACACVCVCLCRMILHLEHVLSTAPCDGLQESAGGEGARGCRRRSAPKVCVYACARVCLCM